VTVFKRLLPLALVALTMTSATAAEPPKTAPGPKAMVAAANPMAVDAGLKVAPGVKFLIQCGSMAVEQFVHENGLDKAFEQAGVTLIRPGCGACIGCGPGVSDTADQVTISAINRNYKGRSGPGKLWLASPLTVAASAFTGKITAYTPGMFSEAAASA
jgi:homoaconitase/3-isopropylmalate dehydratase large subunit